MTNKIPFLVPDERELKTLDFSALEEEAAVQFRKVERQEILDATNSYLEHLDMQDERLMDAEMKENLEDIAKSASDLANRLSDSDYKGRAMLIYCWPGNQYNPQNERLFLSALAQQAEAAAAALSPPGGRPRDFAFAQFIHELRTIWRFARKRTREQARLETIGREKAEAQSEPTDKGFYRNRTSGKPEGPFFFFLCSILQQSTGKHRSPEALYKAIKSSEALYKATQFPLI